LIKGEYREEENKKNKSLTKTKKSNTST